MAMERLAEIREEDATGDTALLYEQIRATLGTPVVNYIWRHLATIEGALPWCWTTVAENAPRIQAAQPSLRAFSIRLLVERGIATPSIWRPRRRGLGDGVASYNRGNAWNLLSMTLLAAARAGQHPPPFSPPAGFHRAPTPLSPPPYPNYKDLRPEVRENIDILAAAGPAATTGIRPSLWVHLGLWPDVLDVITPRVAETLASASFAGAHALLLRDSPALLELFRRRIAEMVLIGVALAAPQ